MPVAKTKKAIANPMRGLRDRLSKVGVKRAFLNQVVLPDWWEDSLAQTQGGFREAASYVCAHLGFSLKSLLDEKEDLSFSHPGSVKYKKSREASEKDVELATHYALGVARATATAFSDKMKTVPDPVEWRQELLALSDKPWVCLRHILKATWELGIPVLHLRNLPPGARKPDALTTMIGERPVIVVMSGRKSPSWVAFIVGHELGHIHRGHLKPGQTLVDEKIEAKTEDTEEGEANDYASRLLTGHSDLGLHSSRKLGMVKLAHLARAFGSKYKVAPGVAALNYGFTTGLWPVANGAVSIIEKNDDAAKDLKKAVDEHLDKDGLSEDALAWINRATSAGE